MLTTKTKIAFASAVNRALLAGRGVFGLSSRVQTTRGGVHWDLDLNEGIDLAIYLGMYQKIPARVAETWISPGCVAFDIGANIGAFTLPLSERVGKTGCVVAIEPTAYAFQKLTLNSSLNPDLDRRIIKVHAALGDGSSSPPTFYSRWPLRGDKSGRHNSHLGQLESAAGARFATLDNVIAELKSSGQIRGPVGFIKLDVDGHELAVLRGATELLQSDRPVMLIEIAPALQDEVAGRFEAVVDLLERHSYCLEESTAGTHLPLSASALRKLVKAGASIDAIARPA